MKNLNPSLILATVLFASGVFAGQERGGGDTCEQRFKSIGGEIKNWILAGGPQSLKFPAEWTASDYSRLMDDAIERSKIRCVSSGDDGFPVQVNNTPKVCRFDRGPTEVSITCDFIKFSTLKSADQYRLVHHEYAGVAGLENPVADDSTYDLSNQITDFLEECPPSYVFPWCLPTP